MCGGTNTWHKSDCHIRGSCWWKNALAHPGMQTKQTICIVKVEERIDGHCPVLSRHCVELQVRDNDWKRDNTNETFIQKSIQRIFQIPLPTMQHMQLLGLVGFS